MSLLLLAVAGMNIAGGVMVSNVVSSGNPATFETYSRLRRVGSVLALRTSSVCAHFR